MAVAYGDGEPRCERRRQIAARITHASVSRAWDCVHGEGGGRGRRGAGTQRGWLAASLRHSTFHAHDVRTHAAAGNQGIASAVGRGSFAGQQRLHRMHQPASAGTDI